MYTSGTQVPGTWNQSILYYFTISMLYLKKTAVQLVKTWPTVSPNIHLYLFSSRISLTLKQECRIGYSNRIHSFLRLFSTRACFFTRIRVLDK